MGILGDMGTTMLMCDSVMMAVWQVLKFNLSNLSGYHLDVRFDIFQFVKKNNYDRQDI